MVADIGTDHGHLATRLAARKDVQHVYATDVSPHAAAHRNFKRLPGALQGKLSLLTGDGLTPLEQAGLGQGQGRLGACNTLVLSGMGVRSLFEILCGAAGQGKQVCMYACV